MAFVEHQRTERQITYTTGTDGFGGNAEPSREDQLSFAAYVEYRVGQLHPGCLVDAYVERGTLSSRVTSDDDSIDCEGLCSLIGNEIWADWCSGERAPSAETDITVELDTPNGPKVTASPDATQEEILAELPEGWTVHNGDWANQVTLVSGYHAYPLSRVEPTETVHPLRAAVNKAAAAAEEAQAAYDDCETPSAIVPGTTNGLLIDFLGQASTDADEALEAATAALEGSDCPREWELREEGFEYETVTACSVEEALQIARDNVDRSNYDGDYGTLYIEVRVDCEETGEHASDTVTCEAEEPECTEDTEHDWQSPHVLVGGLTENPGVHGKGGGVVITEVCSHCGCKRVTDTWAQNPTTGEQGLRSVSYEEDAYTADELQEAFGEEPEEA